MCTCGAPETKTLSDHTSSQCPLTLWLWWPDQYWVPVYPVFKQQRSILNLFFLILGCSHWKWKIFIWYTWNWTVVRRIFHNMTFHPTHQHTFPEPHTSEPQFWKWAAKQKPIRTRAKTVPRKFPPIEISVVSFRCWLPLHCELRSLEAYGFFTQKCRALNLEFLR